MRSSPSTRTRRAWGLGPCLVLAGVVIIVGACGDSSSSPDAGTDAGVDSGAPLPAGIYRLDGLDHEQPDNDLTPFGALVGNAEVVGLGEPHHTIGDIYRMRHRLFRYLVERHGFRSIAFETPWTDADNVGRYVLTGQGNPQSLVTDHLFPVWACQEVLDLVEWMWAYNQEHPDDPVDLWGFDIQQPWHDGRGLITFLEDADPAAADTYREDILLCNGASYESDDDYAADPEPASEENHQTCQQTLAAIEQHIDEHEATLVAASSEEAMALGRIALVGLQSWDEFIYYWGNDTLLAEEARDRGMAEVFQRLRDTRYPDGKVALWAASWHLVYDATEIDGIMPRAKTMGAYLKEALEESYLVIGLTGFEMEVDFPAAGMVGQLAPPSNDTHVEYRLKHEIGHEFLFVDLAFPGSDQPFLTPGEPYSVGLFFEMVPAEQLAGLVYLEQATAMDAFLW